MKVSVCSEAIFSGVEYEQGMRALAKAGYCDLEFWTWWSKDLDILKSLKEEYSINFTAMCAKPASLVDASRRDEFKQNLIESINYAQEIGCKTLIGLVGDELPGIERCVQHESIVTGLKEMAPLLEEADIQLVIEPLNTRVEHKGYYLWDADEAFEIIDEVGSPNVKILFDIYHQQIMQGDLLRRIEANIDKIGHFHAAGNPGRGELFKGEINYPEISRAIDSYGYKGYIGLEYFPKKDILDGLKRCFDICVNYS